MRISKKEMIRLYKLEARVEAYLQTLSPEKYDTDRSAYEMLTGDCWEKCIQKEGAICVPIITGKGE